MSDIILSYNKCTLCNRRCSVNRAFGEKGFCNSLDKPTVARAALHFWEEPVISGTNGSGTIFFSGCSLGCIYCQNKEISCGKGGTVINETRLSEIMLNLEKQGAHNVNFVTPTHFAPSVVIATKEARENGLSLPVVYNTGSYDTVETIRSLSGTIDIYLPDYKYFRSKTAAEYSFASDYPNAAILAIGEMVRQKPIPLFDNGIMTSGVIVRFLLLPGHLAEAKLALSTVYQRFGNSVYLSLMNQYTPMPNMKAPLNRCVTREDYRSFVSYAEKIGVVNGFTQEFGTASESFIPSFDGLGMGLSHLGTTE